MIIVAVGAAAPRTPADAAIADDVVRLDPAAEYLMETYKLSQSDALRRLEFEDRVAVLGDDLDARFGEGYGGMWAESPPNNVVVVGVRPGQEQAVRDLAAAREVAGLKVVSVQRTLAELTEIQDDVFRQVAASGDSGLLVGQHLESNQVTLAVEGGDVDVAQRRSLLEALEDRHAGAIRVEDLGGSVETSGCWITRPPNIDRLFCDPPLRGGVGITDSGGASCSAGFNVRSRSDGMRYLLTAGHCGHTKEGRWKGPSHWATRGATDHLVHEIGPAHAGWFDAAHGDEMIISVSRPGVGGWNPKPWVVVTGDGSTAYDEEYVIAGDGLSRPGLVVCMTGRRDFTECGTVRDHNARVPDPWHNGIHVAWVVGGCARGGDSGGPVYKNHLAYGIVQGSVVVRGPDGKPDPNRCSNDWFYQGIRGALANLNVRLITTTNP